MKNVISTIGLPVYGVLSNFAHIFHEDQPNTEQVELFELCI